MLVDYKDVSSVKKSIAVEIPAEAIQSEVERVTNEFSKQTRIPGFRPGKVPTKVVRTRFLKEIDDEVMQRLLPRFFAEVVKEKGLSAVGNPELTRMDPLVEGAPLRFDADFEVKPPVELKEYRGLEVTEAPVEVSDKEIDATIDRFREQSATFRPVTDRPAALGDFVMIDVASSGEGVEERKTENYQAQLGEETPLPELRDALIGKSVGESASFEKKYEDDAPNESVRGKTVRYDLTLKEIQQQELPELNDEFAKSLGFGDTLEEFRGKIAEDMRNHRQHEVAQAKRQELAEKLSSLHEDIEVPEVMVQEEIGKSLRNYARFLSSQGIDLDKADIDWEKMREEFRADSIKRVRRQLVLEEIAKKENITVDESEVDAEIKRATGNPREFAEVKHRLMHDGGYDALRLSMMQEKALDLVVGAARPIAR